jgi:hypothetical protein
MLPKMHALHIMSKINLKIPISVASTVEGKYTPQAIVNGQSIQPRNSEVLNKVRPEIDDGNDLDI